MIMKRAAVMAVYLSGLLVSGSWATFSICAVDTVTGEVGSAGASCVNGSIMLSDVHPNQGVVHSQASYLAANQNYARTLMDRGLPPQTIVDSVVAHDAQGNPAPRQYGVVTLAGALKSAGYTGTGCTNYKNHITGPTYAIQGNILLGRQILDSMQVRFNRTNGDLACKLMAALQGAKVPGADTRCASNNTSTLSAFIRVARRTDVATYYIDINLPSTPAGREPIDSLQKLFNTVHTCSASINDIPHAGAGTAYLRNPVTFSGLKRLAENDARIAMVKVYTLDGRTVLSLGRKSLAAASRFTSGSHCAIGLFELVFNDGTVSTGALITVR
jgi:uncharacterized Ntn-hydrolase superfamily protein